MTLRARLKLKLAQGNTMTLLDEVARLQLITFSKPLMRLVKVMIGTTVQNSSSKTTEFFNRNFGTKPSLRR